MSIGTKQSFGMRVRALRKRQGLGVRQFAMMVSIDKNSLVDIEYGRNAPTLDTIDKIARGLDVPLSVLFEHVELLDEPLFDPDDKEEAIAYHALNLPKYGK